MSTNKPVFRTFNDLSAADVVFDLHMHTTQTDGTHSAEEMIARARTLNLKAIAITDHVNRGCPWFQDYRLAIEDLRRAESMVVYVGLEAKALDFEGELDASDDVVNAADLIVGSVHRYPDGQGGLVPLSAIPALGWSRAAGIEFELALGLVKNRRNRVDVLGHPFGVFSNYFDVVPVDLLERLMAACADEGVAFEISTRYCKNLPDLLQRLRKWNPPVSIGSDAHMADHIGRGFDIIQQEIRKWS